MSTLNSDIAYATIDPQSSSRKVFISFTGVTQNADGSATLTGVSRGLAFQYPFTASSTLRQSHPGQSILILSDSPQFFEEYAKKRSDETITGQWTFSTFPITPSTSPASATTTGNVELATGLEAASSTAFGSSGHRLALSSLISTSSAPTSGSVVVVTGQDGNIDPNFLPDRVSSSTVRIFTASSTWSKPANLKALVIELIGAGGGGGGSAAADGTGAGGGGGGGYCREHFSADELSGTSTVFVNVAATTTKVSGDVIGRTGSSTSFGTFATATGGEGGTLPAGLQTGGLGGVGIGCDINGFGNSGGTWSYLNTDSGIGGVGGSSIFGGGGLPVRNGSGGNGNGFGGGGAGAANTSGGNADGGAGAPGIAILTEFF